MFRGKLLEEMTREELIEAVEFLGAAYHTLISGSNPRALALGHIEMMRRGEK